MKRRTVIAGVAAAGAAVAAAVVGLYRSTDIFVKHYAPSPYDDLLSQVVDREAAATLGKAAAGKKVPYVEPVARKLRREPKFAVRVATDAQFGRIVEVEGWIVPESVADYSLIAYRAQLFDGY